MQNSSQRISLFRFVFGGLFGPPNTFTFSASLSSVCVFAQDFVFDLGNREGEGLWVGRTIMRSTIVLGRLAVLHMVDGLVHALYASVEGRAS